MSKAKVTMSKAEIAKRVALAAEADGVSGVDLRAIERFLDRKAYRDEYNKRPDVKAKRKEYNRKRLEEEKRAQVLLAKLEEEAAKRK